ncbi:MAG: hypothetical protein MRJ67_14040 [Nitrospirales bacterium]|nr:hypothetical protein [Nitrospira sp.]MDR4461615.1 hypothetical protein [Nitrospirales bacterium]MDR4483798.1 hypothetical protein [Nitrospirales bacterium]
MNRITAFLSAFLVFAANPAFANEPGGGYEGITAMYYGMIGVILAYGVYDIFFKKS